MQRLLNDAQKISGVKYDMSNLSDVYNAIHVIQENMGVTGTTAKEASSTFTGSLASMKSAWSNLLGNMSTGGDVTGSMEALIESASTFLFDNAIPMIGNVFTALPSAIKTAISKSAPKIKEAGGDIVKSLKDGLIALLPSSMGSALESAFKGIGNIVNTMAPVVQQIGDMFGRVAPVIADTLGGAFGNYDFIGTFANLISGAIPVVESLLIGLAGAFGAVMPIVSELGNAFVDVFPDILGAVNSVIPVITPIFETLGSVISSVLPVAKDVISVFSQAIQQVMPIVSQIFSSVASVVMPIISSIAGLIQSAMPIVSGVISTVVGAVSAVLPTFISIFESIGSKVQEIVGVVQSHMPLFQKIFEMIAPIVESAFSTIGNVISSVWSIISPIIDLAISGFDMLLTTVEVAFPAIQAIIEGVWSVLEGIFNGIASGISKVGDAMSGISDLVGSGVDTVKSWFGYAYGKDRVPYDNYPAMLHAGEKVLTRNQADQYERAMSTRGVQLTQGVAEVPRANNTGNTTGNTGISQEVQEVKKAGTTVNIEKLADTVVIEKEADVDRVVEDMINKFRKLVPNMA